MAGYWNLSRTQPLDIDSVLVLGATAEFFESGTTTPMVVYQDASLGLEHPNPIETDGYGRWPGVFFDDATFQFYRVRVSDPDGGILFDDDGVPILGQLVGDGGGGGPPVDTNGLIKTGDIIFAYKNGTRAGYVRCNGRTVGSGSSGATERANSDTHGLFLILWAADTHLAVSGGRGVSAAADWAANKTITLPDMRGRAPFGCGSMGNTASGRIKSTYVDSPYGTDIVGGPGGEDEITLDITQIPAHAHSGHTGDAGAHGHKTRIAGGNNGQASPGGLLTASEDPVNKIAYTDVDPEDALGHQIGGVVDHHHTIDSQGGGLVHENMPPFILGTFYIRL